MSIYGTILSLDRDLHEPNAASGCEVCVALAALAEAVERERVT